MDHNLVPPFILREAGHTVNECPKYQLANPSNDDHCILLEGSDSTVCVPLQLNGIFSFFRTRRPAKDEVFGCSKVFMTPDSSTWDPYCSSYAANERAMTDCHGDILLPQRRQRRTLNISSSVQTLTSTLSSLQVSEIVDEAICSSFTADATTFGDVPVSCEDLAFANHLCQRAEVSKMMGSLGSTFVDPT